RGYREGLRGQHDRSHKSSGQVRFKYLLSVGDLLQIQPLGVAGITGILDAGEDILDIFSFSCAKADIQKDADDESCNVVKEIVRMDQDLHLFSVSIDLDI